MCANDAPDATDRVRSAQRALHIVPADGVLGDRTRAAIRGFQTRHHLPATGDVDDATWGVMFR